MPDKGYLEGPRSAESEGKAALFVSGGYRTSVLICSLGLAILTIVSCLPYAPQGPFNARDFTRLTGMKLELNPWTAFFEPFAAPILILSGAPDFAVAAKASIIWILSGSALWGMFSEFRARSQKKPVAILIAGIRKILVVFWTLGLLIFLFVVARNPGWRLIVDDPDLIVADLHSHTTKSHDALVSLQTNLEWHAACGYNLVGLTEHDRFFPHEVQTSAGSSFDRLPAFISGIEAHTGPDAMLLGLCRDSHIQLGNYWEDDPKYARNLVDETALFCRQIHEKCGGVVIALSLKRLKTGRVAELAEEGVDGFEIANSGHPELRPELRRELLDISRSRGPVLVASTDWHGWTGLARTWTVIRVPGASGLSPEQLASAAIRKIREHDNADVIPVVAGYMGDPSPVRRFFSPFVETFRHTLELSKSEIISWWIWVWAAFVLWVFLKKRGFRANDVLLTLVVAVTGLGLIVAGLSLMQVGTQNAAPHPFNVGLVTLAIGAAAFGISAFRGVGLLNWRKGKGRLGY